VSTQFGKWEIGLADGAREKSFSNIAGAGKQHFQMLFKKPENAHIAELMKVVRLFPRFFEERMNANLEEEVTKDELKAVLESFKREKSPVAGGWTVEFYLGFDEYLEQEILRVIEEPRSSRSDLGALVPKKNDPASIEHFRPISLCNLVYKVILKVIANRLKYELSNVI